jgi:hypothetical protein
VLSDDWLHKAAEGISKYLVYDSQVAPVPELLKVATSDRLVLIDRHRRFSLTQALVAGMDDEDLRAEFLKAKPVRRVLESIG